MGHLDTQILSSPLIDKPAFDAVLVKTDGTSSSVMSLCRGTKAILVFWATWCPHCYDELGDINDNLASIEKKGIKIILVDVGEDPQDVKDYFTRRQLQLISLVDQDSVLQGPYRIRGVPTLVFIDDKGIIRNVTHAFPSDYENYF